MSVRNSKTVVATIPATPVMTNVAVVITQLSVIIISATASAIMTTAASAHSVKNAHNGRSASHARLASRAMNAINSAMSAQPASCAQPVILQNAVAAPKIKNRRKAMMSKRAPIAISVITARMKSAHHVLSVKPAQRKIEQLPSKTATKAKLKPLNRIINKAQAQRKKKNAHVADHGANAAVAIAVSANRWKLRAAQ